MVTFSERTTALVKWSTDPLGDAIDQMMSTTLPGSLLVQPWTLEGLTPGSIFGAELDLSSVEGMLDSLLD